MAKNIKFVIFFSTRTKLKNHVGRSIEDRKRTKNIG